VGDTNQHIEDKLLQVGRERNEENLLDWAVDAGAECWSDWPDARITRRKKFQPQMDTDYHRWGMKVMVHE
jgi:hypothetical protein